MLIAVTSGGGSLGPLLLLPAFIVIFYVFLIRPNQNKQKQHRAVLNAIEVGDEVVTGGGMFGHVVDIDEDEDIVTLEIAPGVEVHIMRAGIGQRIEHYDEDDDDEEPEASESTHPDQPDQTKEL
jgi:preprotein translocase subunit YajC